MELTSGMAFEGVVKQFVEWGFPGWSLNFEVATCQGFPLEDFEIDLN